MTAVLFLAEYVFDRKMEIFIFFFLTHAYASASVSPEVNSAILSS